MNNQMKTKLAFIAVMATSAASMVAEAVSPVPAVPDIAPPNLLTAMYESSFHNPASFMVIGVLCVVAWICDTLDFIQQKYVPVYTVIIGASIYWLFAFPASVPVNFPHPSAIFICNGIFCGFIAAIFHRQIVARLIAKIQNAFGLETPTKPPMQDIGKTTN